MSREFGDYVGGYFHYKIQSAAEDCKGGRDPLTKLWGEFLHEFYDVAYEISNSEACDSGPDSPIFATMNKLDILKQKILKIEKFIEPYKMVAEEAVRMKNQKDKA